MTTIFAETALLPTGWAENVLIGMDDDGWITSVQPGSNAMRDAVHASGPVLPGMPNTHSHAFQRAMAGLTERVTGEKDSFWTWRDMMYRFAGSITPDDLEAIAVRLYIEMLKAGYTNVAEFHYLHHQPDG
ncbi:MAG: formimidoylglutamate deiminase, partial [Alphaproteobacteria bacterium]